MNKQTKLPGLTINLKVVRRPEILTTLGISRTTLFEQIRDGLFPKFIRLSHKSVGIFEHEANAVILARAAEKNDTVYMMSNFSTTSMEEVS